MLMTLRTLASAMTGALFFLALALYFVLGSQEDAFGTPPLVVLGGQLLAGLALHLLIQAVGYRTPAIAPGTPTDQAGRTSGAAMTSGTVLRSALSESVAIASVALAFLVSEGQYVTYLTGALVSLVLFALHAFPSERTISRTEASLERDGGTSHLREQLALPPASTGPVQRL